MLRRFSLTVGAMLGAAVLVAGASAAGNAGTTFTATVDVTGAVVSCPGTDYTVSGGVLRFLFHDSLAANGSEHLRSVRVASDVTLTDGSTSTVYRLVGANAAGGNVNLGSDGNLEFTDVTVFNILAPGGGIVGRVGSIQHVNPNGGGFSFAFGECETQQP
jgi:hypothetical protein